MLLFLNDIKHYTVAHDCLIEGREFSLDLKQQPCKSVSLTSDILGGKNAGLRTVWVNPHHKTAPDHLKPDYEIEYLADLPKLLEEIE